MTQKAFTVCIPSAKYIKEADYFGVVSGKNENKFKTTGLTPVKADHVNAPYIKEFPLALECRLLQTVTLGSHTQIIGEIVDVKADETILNAKGFPDIEKMQPCVFDPGTSSYYGSAKFLTQAFQAGKK